MAETKTAKVSRGMKLLDKMYPRWEAEINLATLDLNSCEVYILGQLYGGYQDGLARVFADGDSNGIARYEYGFSEMQARDRMRQLTRVWVNLILRRFAKLFTP